MNYRKRFTCYVTISFVFVLALFLVESAVAAIWDFECEHAILQLQGAQQEAESAHNELDSAKSELESARTMYSFCTPTRYSACDFERMQVNFAVDTYNTALADFKAKIREFNDHMPLFSISCLK